MRVKLLSPAKNVAHKAITKKPETTPEKKNEAEKIVMTRYREQEMLKVESCSSPRKKKVSATKKASALMI